MRLKDRVAIVTEAARELGRAFCLALAHEGSDDHRCFHTGLGIFGHFKLLRFYNYDRKPHLRFSP
jgi:hypothetical protein